MERYTAISLFSGAGGLDVGFEQAGFDILFANEFDHDAADAWRINRPGKAGIMVEGDINDHIHELAKFKDVDVIFGGPPCQGFSVAGKMDPNDGRSQLVWRFMDAVELVNPKVFAMENVAALGNLEKWKSVREKIVSRGNSLGYDVSLKVHHTPDYGVPENRDRVIFIGVQKELGDTKLFYSMLENYKAKPLTAREVLLSVGKFGTRDNPQTCTANISLATNPVMRRSPYAGMLVNGAGRPIDLNGIAPTLPASMGGNKTPIVDEVALYDESAINWFEKYHEGLCSKTIVPGAIEVPTSIRRLTIKECAAIQTFPENYRFSGMKTKQYKQIGNAVPCRFAKAVASSIRDAYFVDRNNEINQEDDKMPIDVDYSAATKLLNASFIACSKNPVTTCAIKETIDFVMAGRYCLTYRYVMITNLLAKAVNPSIDILSLQAQDNSPGAYDARTLAKDVVFPFQKIILGNIIDGANSDPLVNNPARFLRLSKDNPVAGGDPKKALYMLCDNLPKVTNSDEARTCIDYIISTLISAKAARDSKQKQFNDVARDLGIFKARKFLSDLLDQGFGGASLVLVATALYQLHFDEERFSISPHPVNQSGKSKRQFSDLDVLKDNKPFMGTELKDKPFSDSDVEHAAETACSAGATGLLFIAGRQSTFASQPPTYFSNAREKYEKKGLYVGVTSIDSLMDTIFASHMDMNAMHILEAVRDTAEKIGAIEAQIWIYQQIATFE